MQFPQWAPQLHGNVSAMVAPPPPCRNGTAKASALIEKPSWDIELLADLSAVMRDASICGLGQAAPNPIDCVIKYFPQELKNT